MSTSLSDSRCPCNSGRKLKNCCGIPVDARPDFERKIVRTPFYERTIQTLEVCIRLLDLDPRLCLQDQRLRITRDSVSALYREIARIWPPEPSVLAMYPQPDVKLRALYLGDISPTPVRQWLIRNAMYTDELYIFNPFHLPWNLNDSYSPIKNPDQFLEDTFKLACFMHTVSPWIRRHELVFLPDPKRYLRALRVNNENRAFEFQGGSFEPQDEALMALLIMEDILLTHPTVEKSVIRSLLVESGLSMSDQHFDQTYAEVIESVPKIASDLELPERSLAVSRGGSDAVTSAMVAEGIGAFCITCSPTKYKYFLSHPDTAQGDSWLRLSNSWSQLPFDFLNNVSPSFVSAMKDEGRLRGFRLFLKDVHGTSSRQTPDSGVIREFADRLAVEYDGALSDWRAIDRSLLDWCSKGWDKIAAAGGLATSIATGHMSLNLALTPAIVSGIVAVIQERCQKHSFKMTHAASILLELNGYKALRP